MNARVPTALTRSPGLSLALLAALAAAAGSAPASAAITYKAGVPDYYQHQYSFQTTWDWKKGDAYPGPPDAAPAVGSRNPSYTPNKWWEPSGGWCSTTAWVNALSYADTKLGAKGLFDHSKGHLSGMPEHAAAHSWQEKFAYANEDLAMTAGTRFTKPGTDVPGACAWPQDIRTYADKWGVGLKIEEFTWDSGKVATRDKTGAAYSDASSTYSSMFDVAKKRMGDGIMVMIIEGGTPNAWWKGSFHAVTLAGIDAATNLLAFADPNDTFRGADWGFSYKGTDAMPTDSSYYGTLTLADGLTVGNHKATYNGVEKALDAYNGTVVSDIFLLTVPGPGTGVLALAGSLLAFRRRRA